MAQAHEQVAAAVARTPTDNVGTEAEKPENMAQAHEQVAAAVARAEWGNAGLALIGPNSTTGMSVFFTVTLDVVDLGYWTKVNGLGMTIATTDRGESAMNFFQHHLPGHLTYDKITLERPVSSNSANIMNWFAAYHMLPIPTAAQICCIDQTGSVVMSWDMLGVTPVAWKGPNFDANQHSPAVEQLTIHHMGFM
jgi:phage tail-like protein